jgi:phage tail-like protein
MAFNFQVSLLETRRGRAGALSTLALGSAGLTHVAGFQECSGLEGTLEVHDLQAGGVNGGALRFPTRIRWSNLVLKRGLTRGTLLWDWFDGYVRGEGSRRDGIVTLLNERHEPQLAWGFRGGLPVRYAGPSLNAMQSAVAVETVEIAHQGLVRLDPGQPPRSAAEAVLDLIG